MNIENYWNQAVSFEQYLKDTEHRLSELEGSQDPEEQQMREYYELGLHRMIRAAKTFKIDAGQVQNLQDKRFTGKILIISEGWCGDASHIVPALEEFFKGKNEVRIIYRDQHPELIDQYLTNGARSIPIVLLLNEKNEVITHWGPRPAHGTELLKKYKNDPENYTVEMFHNDLQVYYSKNRGKDIIDEILELI